MRYWKEEEVIQIRSTREEEALKEVEEEEEEEGEEEGKGSGRRHAKLVRQSRVKESMSPRSIRCLSQHFQPPVHFLLRKQSPLQMSGSAISKNDLEDLFVSEQFS